MKRLAPALTLIALSPLVALTTACNKDTKAAENTPQTAEPASAPARTIVVAVARQIELRDTVELTAEIAPWSAVNVAAEATGRCVELPVEVGDTVAAGDVVARIDDASFRAELAHAEAEAAQAEANLAQAQRDLKRGQELEKTQDISIDDLDRLILAEDTTTAQLAALKASLTMKQQDLDDTVVVAPIGGVVSERFIEVGGWIGRGESILRLVEQNRLKVRGAASQRDRARIKPGLPAVVRVEALPDRTFAGRIRLLGQEADTNTGTYLIEGEVQPGRSRGGRLLPGMQGSMTIELASRQALVVSKNALIETSEGKGLFVVHDEVVSFVSPETGAVTADQIEILGGLEAGDQVVVIGQHILRDGDKVRIDSVRSDVPKPAPGEEESP